MTFLADAWKHEILITRAATDAQALAGRLRKIGFCPVVAPLMAVQAFDLRAPGRFDAVLLTSGNAATAVAGVRAPLLTVGDATAARARTAGAADVESAGGDARDLFELARARIRPGARLLLASGRGQGEALARDLRRAGFKVHRRVVYATRPSKSLPEAATAALLRGRLRAALFLSSETARTFVRVLPAKLAPAVVGVEALAISETTANALAPLPWGRVRVSVEPTLEHVLAML